LKNSLFYCALEFTYQIDLFYTEMAEQERRLRDMTDEMESYKKQQEELEEQRRALEFNKFLHNHWLRISFHGHE
jgi:hypothetical protein